MIRAALILVLALGAEGAAATVLADWSLDEVAARADRVDLGVVVRRTPQRVAGEIFTRVDLRLEKTLKGKAQAALTLWQLGGTLGEDTVELVGDAELPVGARVVVFSYRHADGRRYLVGMSLGAYHLVAGGRAVQDVRASLVSPRGVVAPPPGKRETTLRALEQAARP